MSQSDTLKQCIASELNCNANQLTESDGLNVSKNWDSVAHTSIVIAVENDFDVTFDFDELDKIVTIQSIRQSLVDKGVKF